MADENADVEVADAVEEPAAAEQEEQPAEQENAADDAQEEQPAAEDEAAAEPAEDAAEAEAEAVDEAPADVAQDAPAADEAPAAEEAPKEEESKDEPKAEEAKEEPKKKKGKKKKKKKGASAGDGSVAQSYWDKISVKNQTDLNWYVLKLAGKVGTTTDLEFVAEGQGGAKELVEFFANENQKKSILFGLLQAVTTDSAKSVRSKFIYFRFIGSGVKTITKAKMTTYLGKIDDHFPCKHLTMNINEKCADDMAPKKMATELLRIGGAHKPDTISFGADQDVDVKSM